MTAAVVDASAALAWLLPSQASSASTAFEVRIADFAFEAPFVFDWEVRNTLLKALGRSEAQRPALARALDVLRSLEISLSAPFAPSAVADLALADRLSLFDACYLDRALKRNIALISRDKALVAASRARGVTVHDLT